MRVFPIAEKGARSVYVQIHVFETAREFYAKFPAERKLKTGALVSSSRSERYDKRKAKFVRSRGGPCAATVYLHAERIGTETVTHELLHAAIAVARRQEFNFCRLDAPDSVNDEEEWLCYLHGRLCGEVVRTLRDAGAYGDA